MTSTATSSGGARQRNNTQAVKTVLSELYITWASEPTVMEQLKGTIQELLQASKQGTLRGGLPKSAAKPPSVVSGARGPAFTTAADAGKSRPSLGAAAPGRHEDPNNMASSGGNSPPVATPNRTGGRRGVDERALSPGPQTNGAAAPSRFVSGVDEIDLSNQRNASPSMSSPLSPSVRPVVDPMAPLPQQHHGASPPTTSMPTTSQPYETTVNAHMVPVDLVPPSAERESSASRYVSASGGNAELAPSNVKTATVRDIPVFYTLTESKGLMSEPLFEEQAKLKELLAKEGGKPIKAGQFGDISVAVFKVPIWYKDALFKAILSHAGQDRNGETATAAHIQKFFDDKFARLSPPRRLFELIRGNPKLDHVTVEDLKEMAGYLVASHPGLEFLQQPEFQEYYCRTVAIRIMYALERQQCRKVFWRDFDRSDLPEVMMDLDTKDVNQVLEYFSYEHFYVLYCKFWELDTDRDLLVDYADLCNYGQGSVVPAVIKRVVEGYGRPLTSGETGRLDFEDFVYFCLSEEDKNSEPAVFYWFKVLDIDGDGILSGFELSQFYRENQQRFLEYSESPEGDLAYEDTMCQMLDMLGFDRIKTRKYGVTLGDLRACPTPANFFNMIFNAPKFMLFEHRDPFLEHQLKLRPEKTDWDRFARAEYDRMAAEAQ